MGNQNYRQQMYDAVDKSQHEIIKQIVEQAPLVLDVDVSKDVTVTPLGRAAYRIDISTVSLLIELGAKVDNGGSDGITPLMWAAKRDSAYLVSNLVDYNANIFLSSNEGFTALDYAIVHGNYRPALFLYEFYQETKEAQIYYAFAKQRDYRYVNYEIFLIHLKSKVDYRQVPNFFKRPEKIQLIDPVMDPREPWKKMISRIIEFEEPPMIERSELPQNLQPQNRFWGKMRSYANGVDPNPHPQPHYIDEVQGLKQQLPNLDASSPRINKSSPRIDKKIVPVDESMMNLEIHEGHVQIQE